MLSDGSATRTFCYVADAVVGYLKVLVRGRAGEAYNIGTEEPEISVADLAIKTAVIARELFDYQGQVVFRRSNDKDYLVDNPTRRCPVIEKARKEMDFDPQVSLDDGLRRALTWYAGNREAEAR
jgi:UDP-glucuronate decarboxylase